MNAFGDSKPRMTHLLLIVSILVGALGIAVVSASSAATVPRHADEREIDQGWAGSEEVLAPDQPAGDGSAGESESPGPSHRAADGSTIARDMEPVVVTGDKLPQLAGAPTDELFVYADRGGGLMQIPFQVDEIATDTYTSTTGSPLDEDDEVVFMAADLGGQLADEGEIEVTLPISPTWYRIEVSDPLDPSGMGWAYVVRSTSLTRTFTETYATLDPATKQITTTDYALGFLAGHPGVDYLALHQSEEDILDRTKLRAETFITTLTEQLLPAPAPEPIKNGPVRVIVRGRSTIGYRSMIHTWVSESLSGVSAARLSTDFNENAVGATFYNANTAAGVTIDGSPDEAVAEEPLSVWWQVSDDTGTLVQVADSSGIGGTQTNYYKDDDTTDPDDTGDQRSYGDAGIQVTSPSTQLIYRTTIYVLPPGQANVGESYAAQAAQPLQVTATAPSTLDKHVYLPLLVRN